MGGDPRTEGRRGTRSRRRESKGSAGPVVLPLDPASVDDEAPASLHDDAGTILDALLESAPIGFALIDREHRYVRVNPFLAEINGLTPEELVGRTVREAGSDFGAWAEPAIAGVLETGIPVIRAEVSGSAPGSPDGPRDWVVSVYPIADASGGILGVGALVAETSEERRLQRRLETQYAIARILSESDTLEEAAPQILRAVCENLEWRFGALWTPDRMGEAIRCVDTWRRPGEEMPAFEAATRATALGPGEGLPGTVWATGSPHWIPDLSASTNFPRAPAAALEGLRGAFGFPIVSGTIVVAVMEFFSPEVREPDDALLQQLSATGAQIGRFIERIAAEEALRDSEARKAAVLGSALDAVITMDSSGTIVEFNPAAERIFGIDRALAVGRKVADTVIPERLRARHREALARYLATGESRLLGRRVEMTALRHDGAEFPVELTVTRVDTPGRAIFTAFVRDIGERQAIERERARLLAAEQHFREEAVAAIERLQHLQSISDAALTFLDVDELLHELLARIRDALSADTATILLVTEAGDELIVRAVLGREEEETEALRIPIGKGFAGRVAAERRSVILDDLHRAEVVSDFLRTQIRSLVGAPLLVGERLIGVVHVGFRQHRPLGREDVGLLELVADRAATALENARLYEAEQVARARAEEVRTRLAFLSEATAVLSTSFDYQAALDAMAWLAARSIADYCMVDVFDDAGVLRRLSVTHADPTRQELLDGIKAHPPDLTRETHPATRAIRTGRPVMLTIDDEALQGIAEDAHHLSLLQQLGGRCAVIVPLSGRDGIVGAVTLVSSRPDRWYTDDDVALAEELARRGALAIENARLYDAEQRSRREAELAASRTAALQEVTAALSGAVTASHVADVLVGRGVGATGAIAGLMAVRSDDGRHLEVLRSAGYEEDIPDRWRRYSIDDPVPVAEVVRTGEPVLLSSRAERDEAFPVLAGLPPAYDHSMACLPLLGSAEPNGAIVFTFAAPQAFDERDVGFMLAIARQCGQALERARLYESERSERERRAFLAAVSEALSESLNYQRTLHKVARLAVHGVEVDGVRVPGPADWCAVDILDDTGLIRSVAVEHREPEKIRLAQELRERFPVDVNDPGGVANVIRTGHPELYGEITDELLTSSIPDPQLLGIARNLGLSSSMTVPLVARGRAFGAITLVAAESGRRYGPADLSLAVDLARRSALALDNARLYRERSYVARTLQNSLLPPDLPEIPGVEVAAKYRPAGEGAEIGGDFYDVFAQGQGGWIVAVGDVCGKGTEAAAITGLARHTIRAAAARESSPVRILTVLNEAIVRQDTQGRFCTVVCGRLDAGEGGGGLTISSGGHPLPLVLRADGRVETAGRPGTLLGVFPDPDLAEDLVTLGPGDAVVLYTDGVTEERAGTRIFGHEGLTATIAACRGCTADQIAEAIEQAVMELQPGAPRDDIALLVLRIRP